jgi:hypothetical protein
MKQPVRDRVTSIRFHAREGGVGEMPHTVVEDTVERMKPRRALPGASAGFKMGDTVKDGVRVSSRIQLFPRSPSGKHPVENPFACQENRVHTECRGRTRSVNLPASSREDILIFLFSGGSRFFRPPFPRSGVGRILTGPVRGSPARHRRSSRMKKRMKP